MEKDKIKIICQVIFKLFELLHVYICIQFTQEESIGKG